MNLSIRLISIAAKMQSDTKVAARAALKAAGLKQTLAEELLATRAELENKRRILNKTRARIVRRLGYEPVIKRDQCRDPVRGTPSVMPKALLPLGIPTERLDALRRKAVIHSYRSAYRVPALDHGNEFVSLTTDPSAVGVDQKVEQEWGQYSRACKYPKQITNTFLTVPADWRVRVDRKGISTLDGMLTLDAAPMPAPAGIDLYAATWLVQGRGYAVTVVRGYIAKNSFASFHADTATAALSGLARKIRARDMAVQWEQDIAAHGLYGLAARVPELAVVRVTDARAIGACEYGIRSWCHATGLPYDVGHAPLRDVLDAYRREPRTEARAAILQALRRYRALERLAA